MSGLINSAGSKSGIIGTTELDYEKGDWTPEFYGSGGSAGASSTTNSTQATYTRIGRMCHVQCDITWSDHGSYTGQAKLRGLPFEPASYGAAASIAYTKYINYAGEGIQAYFEASGGTGLVSFVEVADNAGVTQMPLTAFAGGGGNRIFMSCSYTINGT